MYVKVQYKVVVSVIVSPGMVKYHLDANYSGHVQGALCAISEAKHVALSIYINMMLIFRSFPHYCCL